MEDKKTFWTKKNKIILAFIGLSALLIIFIIALAAVDAEKSARIKELYAKSGINIIKFLFVSTTTSRLIIEPSQNGPEVSQV